MLTVLRIQKLVALGLLLFISDYTYSIRTVDCGGFTSSLVTISQDNSCSTFQLEVSYDGSDNFPLEQLFVSVPECGEIQDVSNSENWDVILNVTDQYSGLSGFHISSISGFGGNGRAASFTVDFTVCADDIICQCTVQNPLLNVTYEAGSCIEFDEVGVETPAICDLTPPSFKTCDDIRSSEELYRATSVTANEQILQSLIMANTFTDGDAKFDFTNGQLVHDSASAQLFGELTLSSGGGALNGTQWAVNINFVQTDIVNPKIELGQGPEYTDTWTYFVINDSASYLYRIDSTADIITLSQRGNPFQIGLSAGGKDLSQFSASGWFDWQRNGADGIGDIIIDLEDLCPPQEGLSPVLECVEYIEEEDIYLAHFGYSNNNDEIVIMPIGQGNKFTPSPIDRGQPFVFEPGRHVDVFQVEFDGNNLVWTLASPTGSGRTATASDNPDQRCIAPPTATLAGDLNLCPGDTGQLTVELNGAAPWSLTYTHEGEAVTVQVESSPFTIDVGEAGEYELTSITDRTNQAGTATGTATVSFFETPTAAISGEGSICPNGGSTQLTLDLTGASPWEVVYRVGQTEFQTTFTDAGNAFLPTSMAGVYELVSVTDANCQGEVSGQGIVNLYDLPTAVLSGGGEVCAGETTEMTLELTGAGPWTVTYTNGAEQTTLSGITETSTNITASAGNYSLVSVEDNHCSGNVSGTASITVATVTASISGGGEICRNGGAAEVLVLWGGSLPWSMSYTDGVQTYEVSGISTSQYVIETDRAGTYSLLSAFSEQDCDAQLSGSAEVVLIPDLEGAILVNESACAGDQIMLQSSISGNVEYNWSTTGSGNFLGNNEAIVYYVPAPGEEEVSFALSITTACETIELTADTKIITLDTSFTIEEVSGGDNLLQNLEYTFVASETEGDLYEWYVNGELVATGVRVVLTFDNIDAYDIELKVSKEECIGAEMLSIIVEANTNLFIPNVFNPSSTNPENNRVKVYGESLDDADFEFAIYNRWGTQVYSTRNLTEAKNRGWTGNHSSEELENNVFTYVVRGKFLNGRAFEETGTITLVR